MRLGSTKQLSWSQTSRNTEVQQIKVNGLPVSVVRKGIKNLHFGVYPPKGRVRVAAPLAMSDDAVRLAVVWLDKDFDPSERAFYYARVIEVPAPRWTADDAKYVATGRQREASWCLLQHRTRPSWLDTFRCNLGHHF